MPTGGPTPLTVRAVFACVVLLAASTAFAAPCPRLCKPAIQRCVAAGDRRGKCKRQLVRCEADHSLSVFSLLIASGVLGEMVLLPADITRAVVRAGGAC